jgi:uncharacterized protein
MLAYQDRPLPEPLITPENQAFFEATAKGEFLLRYCKDCKHYHWHPRVICPHCGSDNTEWQPTNGKTVRGTIYSYSVLRKGVEFPYCLAYVNLPQGISMLTNIVDCDFDALHIGQEVELCFKPTPKGVQLPMFRVL